MKIALIAPVVEVIPPRKHGGSELVVHNLAVGLAARGHDVHVFAARGSATAGTLREIFPAPLREYLNVEENPENQKLNAPYTHVALANALEILTKEKFDIIHNHMTWRILPFEQLLTGPLVSTWHVPLSGDFMVVVNDLYQQSRYISLCDHQRLLYPDLNYVATIPHGIDVASFEFNEKPGDYLAFLGRMSPQKGPKEAILAAKAAGKRLVMAARVEDANGYFETEIKPLIDGEQIQFIGEVDHAGKVELLKNAQALLAPIQGDEAFGLYFVEALACGTPVVAVKRSSVPEIIRDGVTGFTTENTTAALVEAINAVGTIDRHVCRKEAEERFTIEKMAESHEKLYESMRAAYSR